MSKRQKKSSDLLRRLARPALALPVLVVIARKANSPNAAHRRAYLETGDVKLTIACQNLAQLKRDYGRREFEDFVSSVVSSLRPPKLGQEQKENDDGKEKSC